MWLVVERRKLTTLKSKSVEQHSSFTMRLSSTECNTETLVYSAVYTGIDTRYRIEKLTRLRFDTSVNGLISLKRGTYETEIERGTTSRRACVLLPSYNHLYWRRSKWVILPANVTCSHCPAVFLSSNVMLHGLFSLSCRRISMQTHCWNWDIFTVCNFWIRFRKLRKCSNIVQR